MSQFRLPLHSVNISPVRVLRSKNAPKLLLFAFSLLFSGGCEKKNTSIIDSIGQAPSLSDVTLSPSSINTDSINIGSSRKPEDILPLSVTITVRVLPAPGSPISSAHFFVRGPDNTETFTEGELVDDGAGPDPMRGDGIYTARAAFQVQRVAIGAFNVEVVAETKNGFLSNTLISPLTIYRGNHPPVLSNLQAPDTVQLGSQAQLLTLGVTANDLDGLADVSRVIFNSYKPDGSPSSGNPFQMHDDGSNGDARSGDGIFGLIISLPPTTLTGTYRFEFQAFDRSNAGSNIIVQRITVKQ